MSYSQCPPRLEGSIPDDVGQRRECATKGCGLRNTLGGIQATATKWYCAHCWRNKMRYRK